MSRMRLMLILGGAGDTVGIGVGGVCGDPGSGSGEICEGTV